MDTELVKITGQDVAVTNRGIILPAIIADAGEKAGKRFIEFLTATIRNGNTRQAYRQSSTRFSVTRCPTLSALSELDM